MHASPTAVTEDNHSGKGSYAPCGRTQFGIEREGRHARRSRGTQPAKDVVKA